jgi:ATP-dependent Clp protease ATP-binding subunit ClpC
VLLGLVAEDTAARAAAADAPPPPSASSSSPPSAAAAAAANTSGGGYLGAPGVTVERVRAAAEAIRGRRRPNPSAENLHFSREVRRAFEAAAHECRRSGAGFVAPEHIALALLSAAPDTAARAALAALGVHDVESMRREARRRVAEAAAADAAAGGGATGGAGAARRARAREAAAQAQAQAGGGAGAAAKPTALEEFCRDLCAEARAGRIDPVIGREREVARVMQVLGRRTKVRGRERR